jgi:hypothetical protein
VAKQRRIDLVRVQLSRGKIVPLPWKSREALLKQLSSHESLLPLVDDLKGAGTSRPVVLTPEQEVPLMEAIDLWVHGNGDSRNELPDGVHELRDELTEDL